MPALSRKVRHVPPKPGMLCDSSALNYPDPFAMESELLSPVAHGAGPVGAATAKPRKKSAGPSPTQRSLARLKAAGYDLIEVVERWNQWAKIRQDLFGFIDILALKDGEVVAIQATSGDNVSKRVEKIAEHPNVAAVRKAGWRIEVHGWRKLASSGRWECRVVDVS